MELDLTKPEVKAVIDAEAKKLADEIAGGLKVKNTELMDEVKAVKAKLASVDLEEYQTLKAKEKEKSFEGVKDAKELRERLEAEWAPKLTEAEKRAEAAEKHLKQYKIDSELTQALAGANVHPELLEAAKNLILGKRQVDITDSGAVVDGLTAKAFIEKWTATDGKAFMAAPANNGGGAKGGNGGGASGKKPSQMTPAEKAAFISENGLQAWQTQIQNERAK